MYDFSRDLDEAGKKNLRDFVESGKGVVVLHHALLNYQNWAWWYRGGGRRQLSAQREGDAPSSSVKNDQQISVTPGGDAPGHRGDRARSTSQDEAYKNMRMSPKIRPLLTTDNPTSDRILAWVGPARRFAGGRDPARPRPHGVRQSLLPGPGHNAILWAAGKTK